MITPDILNALRQHKMIGKRFMQIIATNRELAWCWAIHISGEPFPQGEPAIAEDAMTAFDYSRWVLQEPWPMGEPAISKSTRFAYKYAKWVLNGPFPAGEEAISKDAAASLGYADVLKRPFPKGEPAIMVSPRQAEVYAEMILKRPWPEAEPYIARDNDALRHYLSFIGGLRCREKYPEAKQRFEDLLARIQKQDDINF